MKSYLASQLQRVTLEDTSYDNKPMYFFKEPTLSNDSTKVEYNYYWLNADTINSDGSTYADPDFGSNHLKALTNSVNTRTYFGKFDLTIEQRESLQEFTKSYDKQGMYELNFFYGKLGEISSTYMLVFDGRPFCVFCLFFYFFVLIFGFPFLKEYKMKMLLEPWSLVQIMNYPLNITISFTFNSTNASMLLDYDDGQSENFFYEGKTSAGILFGNFVC